MSVLQSSTKWIVARRDWVFAGIILILAVIMRFWHFGTLPPGLTTAEAVIGIQAQNLLNHGWIPGLSAANGYAPLFVWLQAGAIAVFGPTTWALRVWPAVLGVASVVALWIWTRSWFSHRIAGIAAFVLAVTPWAVMIARNGTPTALAPLLTALTFMIAGYVYTRRTANWQLVLVLILCVDLLSGPLGWTIAASCLLIGAVEVIRARIWGKPTVTTVGVIVAAVLALTAVGYLYAVSWGALKHIGNAAVLVTSITSLADIVTKTLFMFNLQGDDSFVHNLGGQPLLNVFTGLMFIAGLLVSIARLHERRYRVLLALFGLLLIPAFVSGAGVPNAAHAAAVLPVVMILVGIGISYMLELWFATFPINSAARSIGQAAIIVLLGLTFVQSYTQYFRAWAGTTEAYGAYNESAVASAKALTHSTFNGQRYLVGDASELPIAAYLTEGKPSYAALTTASLVVLPIGPGPRQFVITGSANHQAQTTLAAKFPGGLLKAYPSAFSGSDLYYVYEVAK